MRKRTLGNAQPLFRPWGLGTRRNGVPVVPLAAVVAVHVGKVVVCHGVAQPRRMQVENLRRLEALHSTPALGPPIAGHCLVIVVRTRVQSQFSGRIVLWVVAKDAPTAGPAILRLHHLLRDPYQRKAGFHVGPATRYLLGPHPAKHRSVEGAVIVTMPLSHRATLPSQSSTSRRSSRLCLPPRRAPSRRP